MLRMRSSLGLLVLCSFVCVSCNGPETDRGGSAPEASGVIEGTVLYVGPRPRCTYDGDVPSAVDGNVVLLLFRFDNPPPPLSVPMRST